MGKGRGHERARWIGRGEGGVEGRGGDPRETTECKQVVEGEVRRGGGVLVLRGGVPLTHSTGRGLQRQRS